MRLFADYHTHTKFSDGRGTLEENVQAARRKGLREIAITDHGPNNIGTGVRSPETYLKIKKEAKRIEDKYGDIRVLVGAEADIISLDGLIDVPENIIKELDLLVVGLHPYIKPSTPKDGWHLSVENKIAKFSRALQDKVRNNNTNALIESMNKYEIDIISHPNLGMKINIQELAKHCAEKGTAFEINAGHDYLSLDEMLEASSQGVNFSIDSDAHYPEMVGNLEKGLILAEKANLDAARIINAD